MYKNAKIISEINIDMIEMLIDYIYKKEKIEVNNERNFIVHK